MPKRLIHLLTVFVSITLFVLHHGSAYACSAGPGYDAVQASDIIVAGRITEWQPLGTGASDTFTPILVAMQVDRAFKGTASGEIKFEDRTSLQGNPATGTTWAGASGACGVFDADPTGTYVILGLTTDERGNYQANRLQTFFIGADSTGTAYSNAVAQLTPSTPAVPTHVAALADATMPQALPDTGAIPPGMRTVLVVGSILLLLGAVVVTSLHRRAVR